VLKLADERLYAEKARRRRAGAGQPAASALVKALEEREPQLGQQLDDAALLVRHVATEVGVEENELEKVVGAARIVRAAKLVRGTHDGGGEIPLGARIVAVCEAFQAMTSDRPYRPALSVREALDELKRCAGTEFDPAVVEAFTTIVVRAHVAPATSPLDDLGEWAATVPAPADLAH
jgi:response regulator RpfG family c-di-GMP phosphodiesterase